MQRKTTRRRITSLSIELVNHIVNGLTCIKVAKADLVYGEPLPVCVPAETDAARREVSAIQPFVQAGEHIDKSTRTAVGISAGWQLAALRKRLEGPEARYLSQQQLSYVVMKLPILLVSHKCIIRVKRYLPRHCG
jgi:hypothetical protein